MYTFWELYIVPPDIQTALPYNFLTVPAPVTFEIPAVDKNSIIKKHPPKRLQVGLTNETVKVSFNVLKSQSSIQ